IQTWRSSLKSLSIFPVPSTTDASGSSAIDTGSPVSSRIRLSRFFKSAPPPVRTMPRSLMSAESSGGERFADFAVVDRDCARDAFDEIPPLPFHRQRFPQRVRRADLHFDLFCG